MSILLAKSRWRLIKVAIKHILTSCWGSAKVISGPVNNDRALIFGLAHIIFVKAIEINGSEVPSRAAHVSALGDI